ncbi:MAG: LytTR family DNA-binding domain-containing protein [Ruminococcus sp.]|nr:LytTR family DNA-binding domain-containing protein [Ruminococcus sp.]
MIRSAICDDESMILEQMYNIVHNTFNKNNFACDLFCFPSGVEMLKFHKEHPFDIIFLDILMPDRNGFDIAKDVRTISDKTLLLFVTSQDELVYDSFNYHPFYFLRKGDSSTFAQSLSDAVKKIADFISRNQMIPLKLNFGEFQTVCLQDILYIASNRNFIHYYLTSGEYIPVREQMNIAEEKLKSSGFIRIHKQYIVNMNKIQKITVSRYSEVILSSSQSLPIGRKYRESTAFKYKEYMRIIR